MSNKFRLTLVFLILLASTAFLYLYLSTHSIALFDTKGIIAIKQRDLIITAVALGLAIIIPVFILAFFIAIKYREGSKTTDYSPEWEQSSKQVKIFWAIPSVVILILAVINWNATHELDPRKPIESSTKPLTIQVVALRWKWLFIYPQQNIATVNFIQFPINTPLNFKLTADAPMNSFWIPQLGGQIYSMAGMSTQLQLMANSTGDFPGYAAEINGPGFSGMKFIARGSTKEEFDTWVRKTKTSAKILTLDNYNKLSIPSENNKEDFYSFAEENLYNNVIMKFTMPPLGNTTMTEMNH